VKVTLLALRLSMYVIQFPDKSNIWRFINCTRCATYQSSARQISIQTAAAQKKRNYQSSSSRMRVINHNWLMTLAYIRCRHNFDVQLPHPHTTEEGNQRHITLSVSTSVNTSAEGNDIFYLWTESLQILVIKPGRTPPIMPA